MLDHAGSNKNLGYRKLFRFTSEIGLLRLISIIAGFASSIILARYLGPAGYGTYGFVCALISLLSLPVSGGIQQFVARSVSVTSKDESLSALKLSVRWCAVSFAVVLLVIVLAQRINFFIIDSESLDLTSAAIFLIPLGGALAIMAGTLRGMGLPLLSESGQQAVQPLSFFLVILFLAYNNMLSIWASLFALMLASLICFFWYLYFLAPSYRDWLSMPNKTDEISGSMFQIMPFLGVACVGVLASQSGVIVLGLLDVKDSVASFRIAEKISSLVAMAQSLVNIIIAPYIVRAARSEDLFALQVVVKKSVRASLLVALPVSIFLIALGRDLVDLAYGTEYGNLAYSVLVVLVAGQLISVASGSVALVLMMSGFEKVVFKVQLLALALGLTFTLLAVFSYGAIGAALGSCISLIFWNVVLMLFARRRMNIKTGII